MAKKKRRNGGRFSVITSCISTTMVLILLGTVVFFVTMADNLSKKVREELPVAILLDDNIKESELSQLLTDLNAAPYVQQLSYISKEEGAQATMKDMGVENNDFLETNPILAEVEVLLKAEYTNKDSIEVISPRLKEYPHVAEVIYPIEEIDRINQITPILSSILLGIAVLLGCVSFSLINNTVRMNIYSRRFSINTMKLVGASWGFIRRPFMTQAFWIGFTSALLASSLIGGGIYAIWSMDIYLAQLMTTEVFIATFGSILVCGLFLTLVSAYCSVNTFLRLSASEIYTK